MDPIPGGAPERHELAEIPAALASGVPEQAVALYARWWQLENWIRSLIRVELHTAYGSVWLEHVDKSAIGRQFSDQRQAYMATPDLSEPLAYLDATPLLELPLAHWDLMRYALLEDRVVWEGKVAELKKLRHRIGHCRRPHRDDLDRLTHVLRDLAGGALTAVRSFNDTTEWTPDHPLYDAWVNAHHDDASRLIEHCRRQDDVNLYLSASARPWLAADPSDDDGARGVLWHAEWVQGGMGGGWTDIGAVWEAIRPDYLPFIVQMSADNPGRIRITMSPQDDHSKLADLIGHVFDKVMTNRDYVVSRADYELFAARQRPLDARVQVKTAWSLLDWTTEPATVFAP